MEFGGPGEGLEKMVVQGDVILGSGDQFRDATEHAVAQALDGEVARESLDHVEPGRRGWGGSGLESTDVQPAILPPWGVVVRRILVADQMPGQVLRGFAIDLVQEGERLDMAMAQRAARDDRTVESAHDREKRG